eukprot:gene31859-40203_t
MLVSKSSLLILSFAAVAQLAVSVSHTGYLIDLYCWNRNKNRALDGADMENRPWDHTVHCMRDVDICRNGGFAVLELVGDKYQIKYRLDSTGVSNALYYVDTTSKIRDVIVTVTGTDDGSGTLVSATVVE